MFNRDFYPTPTPVLEMMGIGCLDKIVLEPSAGKGDIIDYLNAMGATEVLAVELDDDLRRIVGGKNCKIIGKDFLQITSDMVSHIDMIVMNPPFSSADKHICHAWDIAPDGCEVIALCNYEASLEGRGYSRLKTLVKDYGTESNLGDVFGSYSGAERRTYGTQIGLVKLFKPAATEGFDYSGFFLGPDEEERQEEGIMKFNEVRSLVQGYVSAMEAYDEMHESVGKINDRMRKFNLSGLSLTVNRDDDVTTKEGFSKYMQKESWKYIFQKMNLEKYVTHGVKEKINKFVEQQQNIPFTMRNIYHMIDIIIQTRQQNLDEALVEIIGRFTEHTHENRFGVEGWKTNEGHMLAKKFIINYMVEADIYGGSGCVEIKYPRGYVSDGVTKLDDLVKVLCNITGKNYGDIGSIYDFRDMREDELNSRGKEGTKKLLTNKWYDWHFFEFKVFKKGTMHLKFKSIDDWYRLNKAYGELKGFSLPEKFKK